MRREVLGLGKRSGTVESMAKGLRGWGQGPRAKEGAQHRARPDLGPALPSALLPGGSRACALCPGPHPQKGPALGLMLYCRHLIILYEFWISNPPFLFCPGLHKSHDWFRLGTTQWCVLVWQVRTGLWTQPYGLGEVLPPWSLMTPRVK